MATTLTTRCVRTSVLGRNAKRRAMNASRPAHCASRGGEKATRDEVRKAAAHARGERGASTGTGSTRVRRRDIGAVWFARRRTSAATRCDQNDDAYVESGSRPQSTSTDLCSRTIPDPSLTPRLFYSVSVFLILLISGNCARADKSVGFIQSYKTVHYHTILGIQSSEPVGSRHTRSASGSGFTLHRTLLRSQEGTNSESGGFKRNGGPRPQVQDRSVHSDTNTYPYHTANPLSRHDVNTNTSLPLSHIIAASGHGASIYSPDRSNPASTTGTGAGGSVGDNQHLADDLSSKPDQRAASRSSHTHTNTHTNTHIHTHIHTHTDTHTDTHIHTHTNTQPAKASQPAHSLERSDVRESADGAYPDFGYNESLIYDSLSEELFNQIEFRMGDALHRYLTPGIIVLGNLSNLVALLVLRRKKFKSSSVAFYMSAYAVANLCFLDLMLGMSWLTSVLKLTYLTHQADWLCRLWTFISNVITYTGIWVVVVMGVDRFVFLNAPARASGYCTVFTAKAMVTFVLICLVVVSIHAMWTYELQPQGCWVSYHQDDLHTLLWPWWSAALYSYVPLCLLLVLNISHLVCFCVRRFRKQASPPSHASGDQETMALPVLVITSAFFLLATPATVTNILDIHLPGAWLRADVIAKIELTKTITELLSTFNYSLLGIVLFTCSPVYRLQLACLCRQLLCCVERRAFKVLEMRAMSPQYGDGSAPTLQVEVDYELCNENEEGAASHASDL